MLLHIIKQAEPNVPDSIDCITALGFKITPYENRRSAISFGVSVINSMEAKTLSQRERASDMGSV